MLLQRTKEGAGTNKRKAREEEKELKVIGSVWESLRVIIEAKYRN